MTQVRYALALFMLCSVFALIPGRVIGAEEKGHKSEGTPAIVEVHGQAEFDKEVLGSDKPVVVKYYASWCGACKSIKTVFENIADKIADRVKVVAVDVDHSLNKGLGKGSVPVFTFYDFKDGELTELVDDSLNGAPHNPEQLKGIIYGKFPILQKAAGQPAQKELAALTPAKKAEPVAAEEEEEEERPAKKARVEKKMAAEEKEEKPAKKAHTKNGVIIVESQSEYDRYVKQNNKPSIVKFWAPWCGHCQITKKPFEELAQKFGNLVQFIEVNIEEVGGCYQGQIPHFKFFDEKGKQINETSGGTSDTRILELKLVPRHPALQGTKKYRVTTEEDPEEAPAVEPKKTKPAPAIKRVRPAAPTESYEEAPPMKKKRGFFGKRNQ